ncbi:MAG: type II secretion system protein [Candidatus Rifleibacteriota bacterium]
MNKKAWTLVEMLVVLGIVGLVFAAVLVMRGSSASADKDVSGLEEYYNLKSRLDSQLAQDIRNAREIKKISDEHYRFIVLNFDESSGKINEKNVEYELTGSKKRKIERREPGRAAQIFDFTRFAPDRRVKLAISNSN